MTEPNEKIDMPEAIWIEPKPATWGAMLFSAADPNNGRAIKYVRAAPDGGKDAALGLFKCGNDTDAPDMDKVKRMTAALTRPPVAEVDLEALKQHYVEAYEFWGKSSEEFILQMIDDLAKTGHLAPKQGVSVPDGLEEAIRLLQKWPHIPFFKGRTELQRSIEKVCKAARELLRIKKGE